VIDQPNRWKSDPCCAKLWKNPGRSSTDSLTWLILGSLQDLLRIHEFWIVYNLVHHLI
jgi:hypothetical protein